MIVVCDGAGSAVHADVASRLVCDAFSVEGRRQARCPSGPDVEALLAASRRAIEDAARERNAPIREFACTLLGAIVTATWSLFVQIGDGAIVAANTEDFAPIFWPSHGEYANETHFLTDAEPHHVQCLVTSDRPTRLAMFTDGLERVALRIADRAAHQPFFGALFTSLAAEHTSEAAFSHALHAWLASDRLSTRTDDDLTLVLAATNVPTRREAADGS